MRFRRYRLFAAGPPAPGRPSPRGILEGGPGDTGRAGQPRRSEKDRRDWGSAGHGGRLRRDREARDPVLLAAGSHATLC